MTDKTQPEALRLAEQYDYGDPVAHSNMWKAAVCNALRRQHARIAELQARVQELGAMARENRSRRIVELEAQLEAVRSALAASPTPPAERQATAEAVTPKAALGGVYAELPKPNLPRGGFPDLFTEWQMRDFADSTHALRMEQAAPKAAPGEPDPADIIAGALQISRGHAIEMMREVLEAAPQQEAPKAAPAKAADSVTAPAGGSNWQDISTAPKDGTRFVAVGQNYGLDSEAQHTCMAQWFRGCWIEVSEWNEISELKYLTHWMPLPPLPGNAARKQAAPKAAPGEVSDTQHSQFLSDVLTAAGLITHGKQCKALGERLADMVMRLRAAPQQEPSHRETVDVVGVRSNGEHVNLEKIAMPPRMKAREIAIEQFGSFKDDDGSDAEMCFGALEYFLEWLIQQGWSKAPQPAPAPLSEMVNAYCAAWEASYLSANTGDEVVMRADDLVHITAGIEAALAAQGGK